MPAVLTASVKMARNWYRDSLLNNIITEAQWYLLLDFLRMGPPGRMTLSSMLFCRMPFSRMSFSKMLFGRMLFGRMLFGRMLFGRMLFGRMSFH